MCVSHSSVLIMLSARPALFLIAQSQRWNGTIGFGVLLALCATGCSVAMAACFLLLEGSAHTHQIAHMELGCKVQCKNAEPGNCTSHCMPFTRHHYGRLHPARTVAHRALHEVCVWQEITHRRSADLSKVMACCWRMRGASSLACSLSRMTDLPPSRPNFMYLSVQLSTSSAKVARLRTSCPLKDSQRTCLTLTCHVGDWKGHRPPPIMPHCLVKTGKALSSRRP